MKTILNNRDIEYSVRKSARAHCVRLTINCDASLVVTVPRYFFSTRQIENFLQVKAGWILEKIDFFKKFGKSVKIGGGKSEYKKNCEQARALVAQKIIELNRNNYFLFNRVAIKNNKTRWGSCSKKHNLNFNYKIIYLPEHLAKYIVAHELCHLKELNHSARFWRLLGEFIPDYKKWRKELKRIVL